MNPTHQLLIRACKSRDPYKRLRSVYRRMYLLPKDENTYQDAMIGILSGLVDEHTTVKTSYMLEMMDPNNWRFQRPGEQYCFKTRALDTLVSIIRMSPVGEFAGLRSPRKFRN